MRSPNESQADTKAWKDSLDRVGKANADAQRAGKKRREEHEKRIAKMHASASTKGTKSEVYR
jgi:hypothetical protein